MALTKVGKLAIAGLTAPILRGAKRARPIKVVDAEGNVVRFIDSVALAESVHARAGIEFSVQDGQAQTHITCPECGCVFERRRFGSDGDRCGNCRRGRGQSVCAGFLGHPCPVHAIPPTAAFELGNVRARGGDPWRCSSCANRQWRGVEPAAQTVCAGGPGWNCPDGARPVKGAFSPASIQKRNGRPWRCRRCMYRCRREECSTKLGSETARVVGILRESGPMSCGELANRLSVSVGTALNRLTAARRMGLVESVRSPILGQRGGNSTLWRLCRER